jgi:hypothetical protein
VSIACAAAGFAGAGCGNGGDSDPDPPASAPSPGPAFYLTAASAVDLRHQAYDAGTRFARGQRSGHGMLMLDFGAARRKGDTWGVSLRSGTFFSNDEVGSALQAAARGYQDAHRQGEVTIVYVNSNANLSKPGHGYSAFNTETAHEAGEQHASAIEDLDLPSNVSAGIGGDIEPGYDLVGSPEVSIELVSGAVDASSGDHYDVGTAPCRGDRCVNGWTVQDVCSVASGSGRQALPEIYLATQAAEWTNVRKQCGIGSFAGVSASPLGTLSSKESWHRLRDESGVGIGAPVAVWPG